MTEVQRLPEQGWTMLEAGVADAGPPARLVSLATVAADATPQVRTVALRCGTSRIFDSMQRIF